MTWSRFGPRRYRALWRPAVRIRCLIARLPGLAWLHRWEYFDLTNQLEATTGIVKPVHAVAHGCLCCGRIELLAVDWRPHWGEVIATWWQLVGLVPGSGPAVGAYERAVSGLSRALAHRAGWHVTRYCRGHRECGPNLDGQVVGHVEHPWLPWFRWTTS